MRPALARMAAAVRGVIGAASLVSALAGAGAPASWRWLVPALAALIAWTALYAVVAWTRGLSGWLVGADLLVSSALFISIGHLVAAPAIAGTDNWVSNIASMAVVTAQLAGLPAVAIPGSLLVVASSAVGARLAHAAGGGLQAAILITTQGIVAAAVMAAAMRTERSAIRAFSGLQRAQQDAEVALARLEDERAQWRFVHNGPLTVLSVAADTITVPGGNLRQRAAAVLEDLSRLAGGTGDGAGQYRLDERLAQVLLWYQPPLQVTASLTACLVPGQVAAAFSGGVGESLENVRRHSGTSRASVELRDGDGTVTVTVSDEGRGFDPARTSGRGSGVPEGITALLQAAGGTAAVRSSPGAGTVVVLEWRRG